MTDQDPRGYVDRLRSKLQSGEAEIPFDPDRRHLLKLSDNMRLVQKQVGDHRQKKILGHCKRMAALPPWPSVDDFRENDEAEKFGIETEDDIQAFFQEHGFLGATLESLATAEAIVRWIHETYTNEHTNQDYRTALRSWGRLRLKLDEPPDTLAWVPTTTSSNFDPVPSERDLLDWQRDVLPMIDATTNVRDAALIAFQLEAGLRGGELFDVRIGDIVDGEHTVAAHVDGKEGERVVHLITSVPYLKKWLNAHPGGSRDDYLWAKLKTNERMCYATFGDYFKRAARNAGVEKDATPTNFRKSNTRWLVLLGFSQARIEDRQGRNRGSEHTARYMARFGDDSNERAYARAHGMDVESEEVEDVGPVTCPRCQRETPREEDHCVWCHFALTHDAVDESDAQDEDLFESAVEAPSADDAGEMEASTEDIREVRQLIAENPAMRRVFSLEGD